MATMEEGVIKKLNAYWTLVNRNDGDIPTEEAAVVMVFWSSRTREWTKFMEMEDVKCVPDSKGNPQLQVTRDPTLSFYFHPHPFVRDS
jgi:hypothetical protein